MGSGELHDSHVLVSTVHCHFAESVAVTASAGASQSRRTVVSGEIVLVVRSESAKLLRGSIWKIRATTFTFTFELFKT